jgi:hypothetical protein
VNGKNGLNGEDESVNAMEVDSDVNEDPKRELQLDDSFEDWYRSIGQTVKLKEDMVQVPGENVFEEADEIEPDNNKM